MYKRRGTYRYESPESVPTKPIEFLEGSEALLIKGVRDVLYRRLHIFDLVDLSDQAGFVVDVTGSLTNDLTHDVFCPNLVGSQIEHFEIDILYAELRRVVALNPFIGSTAEYDDSGYRESAANISITIARPTAHDVIQWRIENGES